MITIDYDGSIIEHDKIDKYIDVKEYSLRLALERGNKTEYDAQIIVSNHLEKSAALNIGRLHMEKDKEYLPENDVISHEYDNLSQKELLKMLAEIEEKQEENSN